MIEDLAPDPELVERTRFHIQIRLDAGWSDCHAGTFNDLEQARYARDSEREMIPGSYRIIRRVTDTTVVEEDPA